MENAMQCPNCQAENPEKAKFCQECGEKLSARCPQCNAELPPNAKFCLECGAKVSAPPPLAATAQPPAADANMEHLKRLVPKEYAERLLATHGQPGGERRMVTILFSDVKGSTAMGERLDPEDVMEVMNGAFEILIGAVYRHEGTLARLMGDAILAFFGAPIAHEDDPARAVRCALEIVGGIQEYARKLETERGIQGFNIRVGINTGLVVVGEVGSDLRVEYTAMGDAINLAARMEQNAPVGGVLISHDTFLLVQGLFEVQALEPVMVKGKSEPVRVYRVITARQRLFRRTAHSVAGIAVPMVGREGELKQLQDAFQLAQEGERQMVTIIGEPGVGKSRLLDEFENWLDLLPEPLYYFKGRATAELQATPFAMLRDLFAYRCQILESDPLETVLRKLETTLGEALGAGAPMQAKAQFIGALLGYQIASPDLEALRNDPQQVSDRALAYMIEYFKAASALRPAVLLFEDLHWADNSSLDAIQRLGLASEGQRLLIVGVTRPGLLERRPRWGEGQDFHTRLELRPLSRLNSRQLITQILCKVEQVPNSLRELVANVAEGNPLYVEELVKTLIEEQVIIIPDSSGESPEPQWQVDEARLANLQVPPTLMGVLQARLDGLPLAERSLLQCAAVVGRVFWDRALRQIIAQEAGGEESAASLEQSLEALRRRELVFHRETSAFADVQEYIFKHAVLREVAYEGLLKRLRRSYHAQVAEWLIETSGERVGEFAGLIGEHLELAEDRSRALEFMQQAAQGAAARYANAEAVDYYTRALALLPEGELQARWEMLLGREKMLDLLGQRAAQQQDLDELERLAAELGTPAIQARSALARANYYYRTSEFAESIVAAKLALEFTRAVADPLLEAEARWVWSASLWRLDRNPEATEQAETALALAQRVPGRTGRYWEAEILRMLANLCVGTTNPQKAYQYFEDSLRLSQESGNRRSEAASLNAIGYLALYYEVDYERARTYLEQALRITREIGDRAAERNPLGNLGAICEWLGDDAQALVYYEQALHSARETGDLIGEVNTRNNLARFAWCQENCGRALALLEENLERLSYDDGQPMLTDTHLLFCTLYRHLGEPALAEAHLEKSRSIMQPEGWDQVQGFYRGWICLCQNDPASARAWLERNLTVSLQHQLPSDVAEAYLSLGYACLRSGAPSAAVETFQEALTIYQKLKHPHFIAEAQAGLAAAFLAQGEPAKARAELADAPALLESHPILGMIEPNLTFLNCWQVLNATDPPLAWQFLQTAYQRLQKRAAAIPTEALRQSYWQNVPWNREIKELYEAGGALAGVST
jgi:class 3 adenylate cyclase/tetratricopeptide (TPR) repeat protein